MSRIHGSCQSNCCMFTGICLFSMLAFKIICVQCLYFSIMFLLEVCGFYCSWNSAHFIILKTQMLLFIAILLSHDLLKYHSPSSIFSFLDNLLQTCGGKLFLPSKSFHLYFLFSISLFLLNHMSCNFFRFIFTNSFFFVI